eukprot:gene11752-13205_t
MDHLSLLVLSIGCLLCGWLQLVHAQSCSTTPLQAEVDAMVSLYTSTNGPFWYKTWPTPSSSSNPCSGWYGVSCALVDNDCHIIQIYLAQNNLTGTIPASISSIMYLEEFVLNTNSLFGSIPSSLGSLEAMEYLYLYENELVGPIPSSLGQMKRLVSLGLYSNQLTGTIPSALFTILTLVYFEINNNMLTGSIPSTIGQSSQIESLYMDSNQLTGSIPDSIGNLTNVVYCYLFDNFLTGSIPESIGALSKVVFFALNTNLLSGTIPSTIGHLQSAYEFYVDSNSLVGSIPSSIGNMSSMVYLVGSTNELTGTIPSSIGALSEMSYISMFSNLLSGSLPASIFNLRQLSSLNIYTNVLSGTIPASLANLTSLQFLQIYSNHFSGTFPPLRSNGSCIVMYIYENAFSGPIADWLCSLTNINIMVANNNRFSDSIPACIADFPGLNAIGFGYNPISITGAEQFPPSLLYVDISHCNLTGTVPVHFLEQAFAYLDMSGNLFSGALPLSIWNTSVQQLLLNNNRLVGQFPPLPDHDECTIQYLSVAGNMLTGPLPLGLTRCNNMTAFFASDMSLTGPIQGLFSVQPSLQTLVIANNSFSGPVSDVFEVSQTTNWIFNAAYNQFTGSLPTKSLARGQYQSLILTDNCLSGTLPADALCINRNMTELLLSGLHAASACRSDLLSFLSTLGAVLSAPLSLLDLSFNRFSGELSTNGTVYEGLPAASQISLQVNMLSGTLPRAWIDIEDIQVLEGNMFACDSNTLGVTANNPIHDPLSSSYSCGSSSTNIAMVVVTVIVGFMGCSSLAWVVYRYRSLKPLVQEARVQWRLASNLLGRHVYDLIGAVVVLLFCTLLYSILTVTTSVYAETYVWAVSLAVQQGVIAGSLLLVWLCFMSVVVLQRFSPMFVRSITERSSTTDVVWPSIQRTLVIGVVMILFHVVPVFAINVAYVYTISLHLHDHTQTLIVITLALFKLVWNAVVTLLFTRSDRIRQWVATTAVERTFLFTSLIYVGVFNLIVLPMVTEVLISPNCFQYIFTSIPQTSYSVEGGTCYWITYSSSSQSAYLRFSAVPCMSYTALVATYDSGSPTNGNYDMTILSTTSNGEGSTVDFQAGFSYNFQCTFSLLQAFAYVFVDKYFYGVVLLPLRWWSLKRLQRWTFERYGTSSRLLGWISLVLPPMMKLLDGLEERSSADGGVGGAGGAATATALAGAKGASVFTSAASLVSASVSMDTPPAVYTEKIVYNTTLIRMFLRQEQALVCSKMLSVRLMGDVAVALSFGLLFPPLGILAIGGIVVDLWSTKWMMDRLRAHQKNTWYVEAPEVLGSTTTTITSTVTDNARLTTQEYAYQELITTFVQSLERALQEELAKILGEIPRVLYFAAVLWSFALFDIVGREVGSISALWALFLALTMPWWATQLWWLLRKLHVLGRSDRAKPRWASSDDDPRPTTEMTQ